MSLLRKQEQVKGRKKGDRQGGREGKGRMEGEGETRRGRKRGGGDRFPMGAHFLTFFFLGQRTNFLIRVSQILEPHPRMVGPPPTGTRVLSVVTVAVWQPLRTQKNPLTLDYCAVI